MEVISITPAAKNYINKRCDGGKMFMTIRINNKGCSGHSYDYNLASPESAGKWDEVITWDGGGVIIAADSIMNLFGSILDLKTNFMEHYLVWENPQATDHCGCGTSFALKTA
jgi:iron-sulfur cluster assembly accessory protein